MSQPIDVSYVELRSSGLSDTASEISGALNKIERDVKDTANEIQSDFESAARDVISAMLRLVASISGAVGNVESDVQGVARSIGTDITIGTNVAKRAVDDLADSAERDLRRVQDEVDDTGRKMLTAFSGTAITSGISGIIASLSSMGSTIISLGGVGGAVFTGVLLAGILALIPAVFALAGAFLDLSGALLALPAAIAVVLTITKTLSLAFQGFGDALKALASGDLEKIKTAMENLAPAARTVAYEVFTIQSRFDALRKSVQQAFFKEITGDLKELADAVFPTLRSGLTGVASELGKFSSSFLDLLSSPKVVSTLNEVFKTTGDIIRDLSPDVLSFVSTMFDVIKRGLPFVRELGQMFGEVLRRFTGFLQESLKTGDFERFLSDSLTTLRELGGLIRSVFGLVGALFGSLGDEGNSVIVSLTNVIDRMAAFFRTAEGQEAIQNLVDTLPVLAQAFVIVAAGIVGAFKAVTLIADGFNAVKTVVGDVASGIGNFFAAVASGVASGYAAVLSFFSAVGSFFGSIGSMIAGAYDSVLQFFTNVGNFFMQLPGQILGFIQALPGMVINLFVTMFDQVFYIIGFGIGTIVNFFIQLPGRVIGAVTAVYTLVTTTFTNLFNAAVSIVSNLINSVVNFFTALPGRVAGLVRSMASSVVSTFNSLRSTVINTVTNIVNSVVNFFTALPGRVVSAISGLPGRVLGILRSIVTGAQGIGNDIINGIINGIQAGVGRAIDAAKRAAQNILSGMKDALGISSPSRKARDEVGKEIDAGVAVGITQNGGEIVDAINSLVSGFLPRLGAVGSSITGDTQSITIAPGAIQVSVVGNAGMTATDAQTVGQLVSSEIVGRIARRRVQLQVRTSRGKL